MYFKSLSHHLSRRLVGAPLISRQRRHATLSCVRGAIALSLSFIALGLMTSYDCVKRVAHAEEKSEKGILVSVQPTETLTALAVPTAINAGSPTSGMGVSQLIEGTLTRGFNVVGYFDLVHSDLHPPTASKEGMKPQFAGWFNAGVQGLVKSRFAVAGDQIKVTLKLFDVESKTEAALGGGVSQEVTLPRNPNEIRKHVHKFANEVIRYYTRVGGFLGSKIVVTRRTSSGKSIVYVSADGSQVTSAVSGRGDLGDQARGQLFFSSYRAGGLHIFKKSGGSVTRISARRGLNISATLSPDGSLLAATLSYQGSSDIYLLDPKSGAVLRRLTRHRATDGAPSWSPDGRRIAFISDRKGSPQVWIMNANGTNKRRLTFQGNYNQSPAWSPRGDVIAYSGSDDNKVYNIFLVNPDDPKQVTKLTDSKGNNEDPTFSPSGSHIAFTSTRRSRSRASADLYMMTLDGRTQRRLTTNGGYSSPNWER